MLTGLNITSGSTFSISWVTTDETSSDNGVAIDNFSLANITLPISLLSFKSNLEKDAINLLWQTASELNNDYFELARSTNGKDFETIGRLPGSGTTTEAKSYTYADANPANGLNYYRLKQVDYDGTFTYSQVISAWFGTEAAFRVFPTQVKDLVSIELPDDFDGEQVRASIYDYLGRLHQSWNLDGIISSHSLEVSALQKGIYFLRLESGALQHAAKLLKL